MTIPQPFENHFLLTHQIWCRYFDLRSRYYLKTKIFRMATICHIEYLFVNAGSHTKVLCWFKDTQNLTLVHFAVFSYCNFFCQFGWESLSRPIYEGFLGRLTPTGCKTSMKPTKGTISRISSPCWSKSFICSMQKHEKARYRKSQWHYISPFCGGNSPLNQILVRRGHKFGDDQLNEYKIIECHILSCSTRMAYHMNTVSQLRYCDLSACNKTKKCSCKRTFNISMNDHEFM